MRERRGNSEKAEIWFPGVPTFHGRMPHQFLSWNSSAISIYFQILTDSGNSFTPMLRIDIASNGTHGTFGQVRRNTT